MPVIRTPNTESFRYKNHYLEDASRIYRIIYAGYHGIPVIRTYITTARDVLISGIHNIFYAGYKNIICSSRRCSYHRNPLYCKGI